MNSRSTRALVALVGVLAVGLFAACGGDDDEPTPAATSETTSETATATAEATADPTAEPTATATSTEAATAAATATSDGGGGGGETVQAPIAGFALPSLTISVGDTVTWSNQDGVPHTATADDGSFDSGQIMGGTFSHTFEEAGTFPYFCEVHPSMTGEITVS